MDLICRLLNIHYIFLEERLIDPLHKWRLTGTASHSCKNPLSGNMNTRLGMYKVLLFKFWRHLYKGSMRER